MSCSCEINCAPATLGDLVTVINGPMYAGKTTELSIQMMQHRSKRRKVMVVISALDTRIKRYSCNALETHSEIGLIVQSSDIVTVRSIEEIPVEQYMPYDVVCIDEAQFIQGDVYNWVLVAALEHRKRVIVCGLNLWKDKTPVYITTMLVASGANNRFLASDCQRCHRKGVAIYSPQIGAYISDDTRERLNIGRAELRGSNFDAIPEQIDVACDTDAKIRPGGIETYAASCPACYEHIAVHGIKT